MISKESVLQALSHVEDPDLKKDLVTLGMIQDIQIEKIKQLKKTRNNELASNCLAEIVDAAKGNTNLMPLVIKAVENNCTLGEIAGCLRNVFGEYKN